MTESDMRQLLKKKSEWKWPHIVADFHLPRIVSASLLIVVVLLSSVETSPVLAAEALHVYGPGGPLPAIKDAAAAYQRQTGVDVMVTGGPTAQWVGNAKADADMVFSGSEVMMSDFIKQLPDIDPKTVEPMYLRAAAILVRPGNPGRITGISDLVKPGHRILVVNGAGQQGLWEDVAGRLGDIETVRKFRGNIVQYADNSGEARQAWTNDHSIDAWLIWTIWQTANPSLADQVQIEPQYAIYRDVGIAMTKRGESHGDAAGFVAFLRSDKGAVIFRKWGWQVRQ